MRERWKFAGRVDGWLWWETEHGRNGPRYVIRDDLWLEMTLNR